MEDKMIITDDIYMLFNSNRQLVGQGGKEMEDIIYILESGDKSRINKIVYLEDLIGKEFDPSKVKSLKQKKDELKSKLPCLLFSCSTGKNKSELLSYNANMILDFDHVPNLVNHYNALSNDKYTKLLFISPSGRGLKVLVKFDFPRGEFSLEEVKLFHEFAFSCVEKYYLKMFNLQIDKSGKNINRICYLPSGLAFRVNENHTVIKLYDKWLAKRV